MSVKVQFGLDEETYDLLIETVLKKCNDEKKIVSSNEYAKAVLIEHLKNQKS